MQARYVCEKCDVRIPSNRPKLHCCICREIKHYKCEKLSKKDAIYLIENDPLGWICTTCIRDILPINACSANIKSDSNPKKQFSVKCHVCSGTSKSEKNVSTCPWCDNICHVKCTKGELGCINCCSDIIPGYDVNHYELLNDIPRNNSYYNPYRSEYLANQIGDKYQAQNEQDNLWSDMSDFLLNCKYVQPKHVNSSKSSELNVLSLNIRSLSKSINTISENISDFAKYDILCFNETNCIVGKLANGIDDILIEGFHPPILQAPARKSGKGGGLAIYVNGQTCGSDDFEKLILKDTDMPTPEGEFLFVKLKMYKNVTKPMIIGNIYRSPASKPDKFLELLENNLSKLHRHKKKHILLTGDFNIDLIKYEIDCIGQTLIETMCNQGFTQIISRPTRITDHSETLIDHTYTNMLNRVSKTRIVTFDISDHLATVTTVSLNENFDRTLTHPITSSNDTDDEFLHRKFNASNDKTFKNILSNENWEHVVNESNAQTKYDNFSETYTKHYNTAYPESKYKNKRKNERAAPKPWILPWLEDACNRKNSLYHSFIKTPTTANKTKYTKMKKFVQKHVQKAKKKYYHSYFEQYKHDSRKQWSMINNLINRRKNHSPITKLIDANGKSESSPQKIAETFNDYFVNIASEIKLKTNTSTNTHTSYKNYLNKSSKNSIFLNPVEHSEIDNYIRDMKNKSTSDTKISAIKIANEQHDFSYVIANIINTSFEQGIFPEQLKTAKVVPIHKNGSKTTASNYRPISLLSTFSKLFEKCMHVRIANFLDTNNLLHDKQFGFRKNRSCEHALLAAQNILLDALSKRETALLLMIDFSKAFDMVDHGILLDKLYHYGIRGIAHSWIKSYLQDRNQYVTISGHNSQNKKLKYGVPQGSILGPLLFIVYINDIPNIHKFAKFILYADDANIIITGKTIQEIDENFTKLSSALTDWVNTNGLSLNIKKTNYLIFSNVKHSLNTFQPMINNIPIEEKTSARFLGVIIDNKLKWTQHIQSIRTKMARYIGFLYKLRGILPISVLLTIFHSFVQSHLNYCSLVWGFASKSNIDAIFRSQKKAIRAIMQGNVNFFYHDGQKPTSTKPTFTEYSILTIHNLIVKNALTFMYKVHKYELLPLSIKMTISDKSPVPGSTHESCNEWLLEYNSLQQKNSLFFKGPLLYTEMANSNLNSCNTPASLTQTIKQTLLDIQYLGECDEWRPDNFKLNDIHGLRRSQRTSK